MFPLPVGVLLAWLGAGCAGYHLGPTTGQPAQSVSVQVNPFVNQTLQPRLSDAITQSLRRYLQRDGTYRLDTHDRGDIIVTGTIREFNRQALSFQPGDLITPLDFQLTMIAKVTARDRRTGRVLFDRDVVGLTSIRIGSDLASAERQAIPLLAEDLARRAASLLVDGEW